MAATADGGIGVKFRKAYLQLRWAPDDESSGWLCHYELVLPLKKWDIRREIWKDGEDTGKRVKELVIPLKGPTRRQGGGIPCERRDGSLYYDEPYRDGAHAKWDARRLGIKRIVVIALDGTVIEKPAQTGES